MVVGRRRRTCRSRRRPESARFTGIVNAAFRVSFLVDDPTERYCVATELRALRMGGDARIFSVSTDARTVEVYLDITESAVPSEVTDRLAQWLGVTEYEVARASAIPTETVG